MDSARCLCPQDATGKKTGRQPSCAIHGDSGKDPIKPYHLSDSDRKLLLSFRIATMDSDDIQRVREDDENRFRERR